MSLWEKGRPAGIVCRGTQGISNIKPFSVLHSPSSILHPPFSILLSDPANRGGQRVSKKGTAALPCLQGGEKRKRGAQSRHIFPTHATPSSALLSARFPPHRSSHSPARARPPTHFEFDKTLLRLNAAEMSETWVNAWGVFPRASPLLLISSLKRPTWFE